MGRRSQLSLMIVVSMLTIACSRSDPAAYSCANPAPLSDFHMSLIAVAAQTGTLRWKHDDLPLYANLYTHLDGQYVIVSNGGTGQSFDIESGSAGPQPPGTVPVPLTAGATRSTDPVPTDLHPANPLDGPFVAGATTVVISGAGDGKANGQLVGYDPTTSAHRWSYPLDRPSHSPPIVTKDLVLMTTGDETPSCA